MGWIDTIKAASPVISGVGLPIALAALCIIVPIQFAQNGSIASLTTKADEIDKRMDIRVAFLDKNADTRSAALDKNMETRAASILKKLDELESKLTDEHKIFLTFEERVSAIETDPTKLLRRIGISTDETYAAITIAQKTYILPRTEKSAESLKGLGYVAEKISPMAYGFLVQPGRPEASSFGPVPQMISPRR